MIAGKGTFFCLRSDSLKSEESQNKTEEPRHDKTNKMTVRPAKTQISLGIRPV